MKKLTEIHPGNYVFYDLQQNMVSYVFEDFIMKSLLEITSSMICIN
jgi:D-serine deaminase-like pyridoxal phosphate-dependent protein